MSMDFSLKKESYWVTWLPGIVDLFGFVPTVQKESYCSGVGSNFVCFFFLGGGGGHSGFGYGEERAGLLSPLWAFFSRSSSWD